MRGGWKARRRGSGKARKQESWKAIKLGSEEKLGG